jgi:hypothetical protein
MPAAHVQSKSSAAAATSTTIAATFSATVGSGNLVCGLVVWGSDTITVTVSDDKSNSYTVVRTVTDTGNKRAASFYAKNLTNAPVTVTATFSSTVPDRSIIIHEASGIDTTAPLDQETGQLEFLAPNPSPTSGSVTTTTSGQYIFGATALTNRALPVPLISAGAGYTEREETGDAGGTIGNSDSETQIQSAAGSIAAIFSATNAGSDNYSSFILTFKAAAAAIADLTGAFIMA